MRADNLPQLAARRVDTIKKGAKMRNYYKDLDRDTLQYLHDRTAEKVKRNKARGKPYKALEKELFLITARLINTKPAPHYDWQDRRDLQ